MKFTLYLFIAWSLLTWSACSHDRYPSVLQVADSLTAAYPDSALALLEAWRPLMKQESEQVQMYYNLLCIKARDKAYITHTSDSLMLAVLHYYESRNDRHHLPEAYYYAGRVMSDLGDAPQALDYFTRSLNAMPEEAIDLRSRVTAQMGTLFLSQGLYQEALEMHKKSLRCSEMLKDTVGMIYSLQDIGNMHLQLSQPDSALYYLQQAIDKSYQQGYKTLYGILHSQLANYYGIMKQYDKAMDALHVALQEQSLDDTDRKGLYIIAGKLYHTIGKTDSAVWYYKQLLQMGTIYARYESYGNLGQIAVEKGDPASALAYFKRYVALSDTIQALNYSKETQLGYSLYNYQLRERENARLLKAYNAQTNNLLYLLICLAGGLLAFIAYRQYQWKSREILEMRLEKLKLLKKKTEDDNLQNKKEMNRRLQDLRTALQEEQQKGVKREEEFHTVQEQLANAQQQMETSRMLKEEKREGIQSTPIVKMLTKKAASHRGVTHISQQEWKELEKAFREIDAEFLSKLAQLSYNFKPTEWKVCLLLKAGFTPTQIGTLTGNPIQTISSMRARMAERMLSGCHSAKDWDEFICSL